MSRPTNDNHGTTPIALHGYRYLNKQQSSDKQGRLEVNSEQALVVRWR